MYTELDSITCVEGGAHPGIGLLQATTNSNPYLNGIKTRTYKLVSVSISGARYPVKVIVPSSAKKRWMITTLTNTRSVEQVCRATRAYRVI